MAIWVALRFNLACFCTANDLISSSMEMILWDIIWSFLEQPKTTDFMASNSDQSLVLLFGSFWGVSFQFLGPTKPFGSLLKCCCWTNDLNTRSPPVATDNFYLRTFFAQLVDFGASSICDRYKGRDSEGSHCQGKARRSTSKPKAKETFALAERLQQEKAERDNKQQKKVDPDKPNKKTKGSGKGMQRIRVIAEAEEGNPANDSGNLTPTPCCPQVNGDQPFYRRCLPAGRKGWHPTKGWNLLSPGRSLPRALLLCANQWL